MQSSTGDVATTNAMDTQPQISPSASRNRKNSTGTAKGGRVVKHRSSRACQSCRTRKVRCDVVANGSRCTNCRLDRLECVVVPSRRGKGNHSRGDKSAERMRSPPPDSTKIMSDSIEVGGRNDDWISNEVASSPAVPTTDGQVPICVTFDQEPDHIDSRQRPSIENVNGDGADRAASEPYHGLLTPETVTHASKQYQSLIARVPLPAFIIPLSERILSEDLAFLAQKGAMTVPEPDLQLAILRGYLFSVHPFMPILEVQPFIHAVLNNQTNGRVSLMLFQAVMFAGLHSLSLDAIHRLGFESTKQAREAFFNRVKLLYEFDIEPDSIAILQSLLLMSSWYSKDDRRQTWNFVGLAYDAARSIGLQREPTKRLTSDKVRHLRRRLWWSLYIRDRMIALGTRRPMRILDHDFDVTMLTLEDFDLEPLEELNHEQSIGPSAQENSSTALMCIQLAKLCVCIGHVVSSQYTTLSTQPNVPTTMMVVSRRDGGRAQEVDNCDMELNEWFEALETSVQRATPENKVLDPQSCSEVHWQILNLTYQTAVNVLHRAQALQPLSDAADAQAAQKTSRFKVKAAARCMTKVLHAMLCQDQVRFLGLIGVTALIAACLSHLLDISSGDEDVRDASTFRLYQSLEVLQFLRGIYASADGAVSFLTSVARTAGVSIRAQVPTFSHDSISTPAGTNKGSISNKATGFLAETMSLANEKLDAGKTGWGITALQGFQHPIDDRLQAQVSLGRDGRILPDNGLTDTTGIVPALGPSAIGFNASNHLQASSLASSDLNKDASATESDFPQLMDSSVAEPFNPSADGVFGNCNSGLDDTMGLESMAFTYDFYSDALGFLNGQS